MAQSVDNPVAETGAGWFSRLFGYNQQEDPTIPNYASNGVDVPMNQTKTVSLWDKYGLNFGAPASASGAGNDAQNNAPAQDQTWYQRIWTGAQSATKFVFCPIFTDCPDPLPPKGVSLGSLTNSAGTALGEGLKSALGPILPILVVLVIAVVAINFTLSRVGVKP